MKPVCLLAGIVALGGIFCSTGAAIASPLSSISMISAAVVSQDATTKPGEKSPAAKKPAKKEKKDDAKAGPKVGDAAPDFTLKDKDGKDVKLSDLKGQVVMIDFWAVWCPPCKAAMPTVQAISEHYKGDKVKVYGLNFNESAKNDPAKYMADNKYTYGLLMNAEKLSDAYAISGIPTFYIIGPDGKILFHEVGFDANNPAKTKAEIMKVIDKALGKGKDEKKDDGDKKDAKPADKTTDKPADANPGKH